MASSFFHGVINELNIIYFAYSVNVFGRQVIKNELLIK